MGLARWQMKRKLLRLKNSSQRKKTLVEIGRVRRLIQENKLAIAHPASIESKKIHGELAGMQQNYASVLRKKLSKKRDFSRRDKRKRLLKLKKDPERRDKLGTINNLLKASKERKYYLAYSDAIQQELKEQRKKA